MFIQGEKQPGAVAQGYVMTSALKAEAGGAQVQAHLGHFSKILSQNF